jgi:arsenate reductase (thioredoxin)
MPEARASEASAGLSPVARHHIEEMVDALRDEFGEQFTSEQIDSVMADSVERLAGRAEVDDFLPVLAHRYARERLKAALRASAPRAEGSWDVVFVSLTGGGRAQLAAAVTTAVSGGAVAVHAAGSGATGGIDETVARVIAGLGIDTSEAFARPASDEVLRAADVIVTMGRSVGAVEIPEAVRHVDWRIGDPVGADLAEAERVRDDIERRVRVLLEELGAPIWDRPPGDAAVPPQEASNA